MDNLKRPKRRPQTKKPNDLGLRSMDMNYVESAILKWDFIAAMNGQIGIDNDTVDSIKFSQQSFENMEDYRSVWLHLTLRETFAVTLKSIDEEGVGNGAFVDIDPIDQGASMEYLSRLRIKNVGGAYSPQMIPVDNLVLLVPQSIVNQVTDLLKCSRIPLPTGKGKGASSTGSSSHKIAMQRASVKRKGDSNSVGDMSSCFLGLVSSRTQPMEVKVVTKHWKEKGSRSMALIPLASLVSSFRELRALIRLRDMNNALLKKILQPGSRHQEEKGTNWSHVFHQEMRRANVGGGFTKYLQTFNESQQQAIVAASSVETCAKEKASVTLIKGPPGTGKTTTLKGLLNLIHVKEYNRYYDQLARFEERSLKSSASSTASPNSLRKPRILVAAPSNIAVDNILTKILKDGFFDTNNVRYNPRIVRVGRGQGNAVKDVSLETLVENIGMDEERLQSEISSLTRQLRTVQTEYSTIKSKLSLLIRSFPKEGLPLHWEVRIDTHSGAAVFVNHSTRTTQLRPPESETADSLKPTHFAKDQPEYKAMLQGLVTLKERTEQLELEIKQREFASRFLSESRTSSALGSARSMGGSRRRLALELEVSILNEAHIVFTTLNSAGHDSLTTSDSFSVAIIDEAAQATEASVLIPLVFCGVAKTSNLVLIGDPQQLRATAFSVSSSSGSAASVLQADEVMQRSLFERLENIGHPVHLLNVQYRMHPDISMFPRQIFYRGLLKDSDSVRSLTEGFHSVFPPFMFINVSDRSAAQSTRSRSNLAEAEAVFEVYHSLKTTARECGDLALGGRVGILTPYREQLRLLRDMAGARGLSSELELNTVDGFQGREKDVIIMSTVRSEGAGVGFLADTRRMNVSLTRARSGLYVIGNENTIRVNPNWFGLIQQAKAAHCFISLSTPITNKSLMNQVAHRLSPLTIPKPPIPPPPPRPPSDPPPRPRPPKGPPPTKLSHATTKRSKPSTEVEDGEVGEGIEDNPIVLD